MSSNNDGEPATSGAQDGGGVATAEGAAAGPPNGGVPTPDSCCPRDSLGPATVTSELEPKGQMAEIPAPAGLVGVLPMPCYITGTPLKETERIVVVFTDVYGIDAGHHKVFADCLAERLSEQSKTTVVIPDLFRGVPILQPWMDNANMAKDLLGSLFGAPGMVIRIKRDYPPAKIDQDVFSMVLPFLQDQLQGTAPPPLSCVGFCFGGWVVGRVLGHASDKSSRFFHPPLLEFDCGVGIHPSFQPNLLHGESQIHLAERIFKPLLLLPSWSDVDMKAGTKIVDALEKNRYVQTGSKTSSEAIAVEFHTMIHGWVSRGDPADPNVAAEQERALQLTVDFIHKHSGSP